MELACLPQNNSFLSTKQSKSEIDGIYWNQLSFAGVGWKEECCGLWAGGPSAAGAVHSMNFTIHSISTPLPFHFVF